jgi:4-aminobutyrate aminotransferase-like enzyme
MSVLLAQVEKVAPDHLVSVILMETCHIPAQGGWHDPRVVDAVRWAQREHGVVVVVDEVMTGGGR